MTGERLCYDEARGGRVCLFWRPESIRQSKVMSLVQADLSATATGRDPGHTHADYTIAQWRHHAGFLLRTHTGPAYGVALTAEYGSTIVYAAVRGRPYGPRESTEPTC